MHCLRILLLAISLPVIVLGGPVMMTKRQQQSDADPQGESADEAAQREQRINRYWECIEKAVGYVY